MDRTLTESGPAMDGEPAKHDGLGKSAMARTLAYMYLASASLALAALAVPHGEGPAAPGMFAVVAAGYAIGLGLLFRAPNLRCAAVHVLLATGTALVSAAVWLDGDVKSAYALLYVWIALEAFYFLPRWQAAVQVAAASGAYAGVLVLLGAPGPSGRMWLLTVGTALMVGVLVHRLRGRIDRLLIRLAGAAGADPLTGLLNQRAFEEMFELELARAGRHGRPLSVLIGDVDSFQELDEQLGKEAGDAILTLIARDLSKWKRRSDLAARLRGGEFALLLPETEERGAFLVAERLRRAVHRRLLDHSVPLSMSFGVATLPGHGDSVDELMRTADHALSAAKELGEDRTVIYSAEVARITAVEDPAEQRAHMQLATVVGLAETLDIREAGNATHAQTVGEYARMTAEELGFGIEHSERVRLAGLLHDVGWVGLPDELQSKPGPLSTAEWADVQAHPQLAARLLAQPELDDLRVWIAAHHERPDGQGYPRGISGDEIPVEAGILAVADAYEAMTNDRAYRPAMSEEEAQSELRAGMGTQFPAEVAEALLRALARRRRAEGTVARSLQA
jgi:diguanylate cyclase (GGDEF)-like protein